LYAHLLNASMAWISPDGRRAARRPRLDAEQYGWSALYRLYQTADGWLCLAALTEDAWQALCGAAGRRELAADPRFADAAARDANDAGLVAELTGTLAARPTADWFADLDAAGVPCEVCDPDYVLRLFSDPDAERRQLVASFPHRAVGQMKMAGLYFDLSETPGVIKGPPLWPGQDSLKILAELGYSADEAAKLTESGVVDDTSEA
jgi:crotonobetainyl-CoA:carnitine CoA-transferase CaiB-like acyl-CoA transferase